MNEKLLADPTRLRQISERIPAGRWAAPADFAGPILFLCSKASQYVSGETLVVDGVSGRCFGLSWVESNTDYLFENSGMDGQMIPQSCKTLMGQVACICLKIHTICIQPLP